MIKGISGLLSLFVFICPLYAEETLQGLIASFRHEQTPQNIEKSLATLSHANIQPLGLPCNALNCQEARLDVVNLDDLLLILGQLWQTHPEQRRSIERIILRWNFCDVNYLNAPHNLMGLHGSKDVSRQAVGRSEGWPGLTQWGFMAHDPDNRIRPELLVKSNLDARSKRQFLYRVERQQCFPNPWNGQTPYDPETLPYNTFYRHTPKENVLWLQAKVKPVKKVKKQPKIVPVKKITTVKKSKKKAVRKITYRHSHHAILPKASDYHVIHEGSVIHPKLSKPSLRMVALPMMHVAHAGVRLSPHSLKMSTYLPSKMRSNHDLHWVDQLPATQANANEPISHEDKLMSNGMFFTRSLIHGYDNFPLPEGPDVGLAGDVQLRWRLKDKSYIVNTSAQWSPYKNFYIHGGLKVPVTGINRTPTYTWGLGYANWKPGGFSLGWNQWAPQTLNTPPTIKNMEFKLGYNLSLMKLLSLPKRYQSNLSFSFSKGVPALHNDWQYNFGDGWFARAGVSKLFARNKLYQRNDWGWTYGFGRSKWQAGSLNIEYANWGFNRIPQSNFYLNGEVILSWRWKLP